MKSNYLKIALVSAVVCLSQVRTSSAQSVQPCGTVEKNEEMYLQHPELRQAYIDYVNDINKKLEEKGERTSTLYTIPMVFHVLHVNGTENVSDANIIAQVARLNQDFRKLNTDITNCPPYFQSIAGDALIQFKLAQLDPNGNCTNGIDRIYSHKTFDAGERSKLNQWPRDKYFNVWVISVLEVDPGSVGLVLAYATFPSSVDGFGYPSDGVIMRSDQVNGTSRTLTHETGHWLGLEHTWGNTEVATVCGDDNVTDTPINKGHFSTCPAYDFACDNTVLSATYAFSGVTPTSGTTDPSTAPTVADSTMTFSAFSATGVSANSTSSTNFNYSDWDIGALNGETSFSGLTGINTLGRYYQFTVTPDPNVLMSLTGITFDVMRDATGPRTFEVRSSANGYSTNLAASITPANPNLSVQTGNIFFSNFDTALTMTGSKITLSGTSFTGTANSITFRIYGYNAEDTLGSFGIDNVVLTGTFGDAENINNYMDYSSCIYMFTQGQVDRMRAVVESPVAARNQLWQNSNLVATGTDGTSHVCTPSTDFYTSLNKYNICEGGSVQFIPNVLNASVGAGAITYLWNCPGATLSPSATSATPTATYANSGIYDVSLTVTVAGNSSTVTKPLFIDVSENYADVPYSYHEGFEDNSAFYNLWEINDLDQNSKTWWKTTSAAYTGSHSAVMNGYYNYCDDVDQLLSPMYDLSFLSGVTMTFRLAAATTATSAVDMNDELKVWSSSDCGANWQSRASYKGGFGAVSPLLNNGYHPEEFVPGSPSNWELKTITIPGTVLGPKVRFKFEYTTGWESNSIYIDDINISGTVGIDENTLEAGAVSIYPNPTAETATIAYHLDSKADVKMELVDVLGKRLMLVNNSGQLEGDHTIVVSKSDLNLLNGIYFVRLTIDNASITKKLVITQ